MKVLTDTGLAYYHSKLQNEFISNGSLSDAIDNYLDNVDWVEVIGNTYATSADVADMISSADLDAYLEKAGGTMTGSISYVSGNNRNFSMGFAGEANIDIGWNYSNGDGAGIGLRNIDFATEADKGAFNIYAKNGNTVKSLVGRTDGILNWDGNKVATFDSNNKLVFPNGNTIWFA